jgi:hypothetical protein
MLAVVRIIVRVIVRVSVSVRVSFSVLKLIFLPFFLLLLLLGRIRVACGVSTSSYVATLGGWLNLPFSVPLVFGQSGRLRRLGRLP